MNPEDRARNIELRKQQNKERNDNDLKVVLEKPEGRRLVYRFMEECGTFKGRPDAKLASEAGMFFFKEVMRIVPDKFLQMFREHKSERVSIEKQYPLDPEDDDND